MKLELRTVHPMRAANVGALVYGIVMAAFALLFSPFFLLAALFAPDGGGFLVGAGAGAFMLVLYPLMGLVMGWISGLITSAVYNFIVRWTGGLLLEFDREEPAADAAV